MSHLARFGYARPHLFVAAVPGGDGVRLAVERFARERAWPSAASPADADVLVVCGDPGGGWLADAAEVFWQQMPAPRVKVELRPGLDVDGVLLRAREELFDLPTQHSAAPVAGLADDGDAEMTAHEEHGGHETHTDDEADAGHEAHGEHGGHGGHEGHIGHGGKVAGLPMADRAPDRDGLVLDQIDVVLGPFLPSWPAGLCLRVALQGDVANAVAVEHLPAADDAFAGSATSQAAGRLDALAVLLDVCGADGWAASARRLRDELLAGVDRRRDVARFARRLRRSRLLSACTDGVADARRGDATDRWWTWLDEAERALEGQPIPLLESIDPAELGPVLTGLEVGGLRIAVASLVPPAGLARPREWVVT